MATLLSCSQTVEERGSVPLVALRRWIDEGIKSEEIQRSYLIRKRLKEIPRKNRLRRR